MRVVILMLSVDEAPMLEHSLPLAVAQAPVVLVDDASSDLTPAVAGRYGAQVVALPERVSYAVAMNAGMAALPESDAVLVLNADCFLDPGCVDAMAAALAPGVGSVAGKTLRVAGPDARPDAIDACGMWIDRRRKNGLVGHGDPVDSHNEPADVFGADGACALYRREVLDQLGPEVFDTDMQLWVTDADLAWRARRAGWRSVYTPAAGARHVRTYSPSKRAQTSKPHRRLQFRNRYLMWIKNETPGELVRNLPWWLSYEILALGHTLLREPFLAPGYVDALRLAPAAFSRRRARRRPM